MGADTAVAATGAAKVKAGAATTAGAAEAGAVAGKPAEPPPNAGNPPKLAAAAVGAKDGTAAVGG